MPPRGDTSPGQPRIGSDGAQAGHFSLRPCHYPRPLLFIHTYRRGRGSGSGKLTIGRRLKRPSLTGNWQRVCKRFSSDNAPSAVEIFIVAQRAVVKFWLLAPFYGSAAAGFIEVNSIGKYVGRHTWLDGTAGWSRSLFLSAALSHFPASNMHRNGSFPSSNMHLRRSFARA